MKQTDRKRFAVLLVGCGEVYNRTLSDAVIALYWESMKHYDIEAVEDAFARHMQSPDTGQYMPKPADIIRALGGTTIDASLIAWSKVDKAAHQVGPYKSVVFDDALIHKVLQDMGGWINLGAKKYDEWPFVAKEFETRYRGMRTTGAGKEYPSRLLGLVERDNAHGGYRIEPPVMIGDIDKAIAVMRGGSDGSALKITNAADIGKRLTLTPEE